MEILRRDVRPAWPHLLLVLLPLCIRLPLLFGLLNADPALHYAGLAADIRRGPFGGESSIDPNIAYTSHALGHHAARLLFSGEMPWWNHFEGIGMPLAGEMQSAALFPFTWLQLLPHGQMIEHIALQIVAGLFTYRLLRALDLAKPACLAGAIAFEFNGVFAWLANAVINPVAFLPMLLFGVERAAAGVRAGRPQGRILVALAIALSLYAGFPEVAYLDGLLGLAWAMVRLAGLPRAQAWRLLATLATAAACGVLIAAPILVPFLDFLPFANLGQHTGAAPNAQFLPALSAVALPFPYVFGTIDWQGADLFWASVGGYGGALMCTLAIIGTIIGRDRAILRLAALWTVCCLLITYGLIDGGWLRLIVPGIRYVWLARYLPPTWLLCMTVLAASALCEMARQRHRIAIGTVCALLAGFVAVVALLAPHPIALLPTQKAKIITAIGLLAVASLATAAAWKRLAPARIATIAATLLAIESVVLFAVPLLSHPRRGIVDLDGVAFLQRHIGLDRFATLGPIAPNYGSLHGLAAINYNDLPAYRPWSDFVAARLDHNADLITFTGTSRRDPAGPSAQVELERHLAAYASVGVRFVVTAPGQAIRGLRRVFTDSVMDIYALEAAAPYFEAAGCTLTVASRNEVTSECPVPARLVRREAWMPGWTARFGERSTDVGQFGPLFQTIDLPAGTTTTTFRYRPPFIQWAWAMAAIGLGGLGGLHLIERRAARRR